jgi:transcriptional regulator GlxA family with amidase domain
MAGDEATKRPRLKIGFVLSRSFTLSAFALFIDTIRLASDEYDRSGRVLADWQVIGSTRHLITSSCGVQVAPTSDFVDPGRFDYIVVVGGLLGRQPAVDDQTIAFLKKADAQKVPLIGLCTGTFILAEAGLMKNHQTCVSWLHYQEFRDRFPDHEVRSDRLFNLDRRRGSCAGGSSSADLAAFIVRQYLGHDAERNALEVLQIEKARTNKDIQVRRPLTIECDDPRVKAVLILMEQSLENELTIDQLARSVGLSRRQLERLFAQKIDVSPARIYTKLRMERAKMLVTQTNASLIDIALQVGFQNTSHFTRVFKGTYGRTPGQMRSQPAA